VTDDTWVNVKRVFGDASLTLAPHYAYMALNNPRHLLFTLARYKFAARMLAPGRSYDVLDMGCSEGFGTLVLAEGGNRVTAVDTDSDAIDAARATLSTSGIDFRCGDVLSDEHFGEFDAVVSLDVIEHVDTSQEDDFFRNVSRSLRPDGFVVIGTPNDSAAAHASEVSKIGHVNVFTAERLVEAVSKWFKNVFVFGMNDEMMHTGFYPMTHYLLVVGCGKRS